MLCKNPPPIPEKPSAGPKKAFSTTSHVHWSNKKSLNGKPLRKSENDDFEKSVFFSLSFFWPPPKIWFFHQRLHIPQITSDSNLKKNEECNFFLGCVLWLIADFHNLCYKHVLRKSQFSHISTKHPKPHLMVVLVCVCRSPQVLPGTTPAPVLKLTRVVMGAIGRSHVKIGENRWKYRKNNFRSFSQTRRFIRKY